MNAVVCFLPAGPDGCAFYRMFMPHLRTEGSRYISTVPVPFSVMSGCNVAVVQRLATDQNYETLKKMKMMGLKIIYDLDDDMWSVQAPNPAHKQIKAVHEREIGFEQCASLCDLVTVSTMKLQTAVRTNASMKTNIRVVNNAIEMAWFKPSSVPKDPNHVIIGWGGSPTHAEDLREMGDAVTNVVNDIDIAYAHFVGMIPTKAFIGHKKIKSHGWVPVHEYPRRLSSWNWDIYLAPLNDNRFNRSKSNIKMLEAGAMKIPCLASDVQPYQEFVSHDKELEFLLCRTPRQWEEKLKILVKDEAYRKLLGEKSYEVVKREYSMEKKALVWRDVFESVL